MNKFCDAVFEGGGVRGIGYVGAVQKFEQAGYKFRNVAGSSAGAIVASLIAAGFTASEMYDELSKINFESFKEAPSWRGFGALGNFFNSMKNFGLYKVSAFESWLDGLLAKKNVRTFADLYGRLRVTATDVTEERIIVLPDDLRDFGIDPNTFKVSTAVRMSMSIPVFYEPYELTDRNGHIHYIIDGGVLSNYPIWILDTGKNLEVPVFSFRFIHHPGQIKSTKANIITYLKQIVTTVIENKGTEMNSIIHGDAERTVSIDTNANGKNIGITDFGITDDQVTALYLNGNNAAEKFLGTWDFNSWAKQFRKN
jgi:NTE family protein